uniref:hypothetical protein n=1 Tax=Vibrio anguillarum TaxID=55601 RepID=UPI001C0478A4
GSWGGYDLSEFGNTLSNQNFAKLAIAIKHVHLEVTIQAGRLYDLVATNQRMCKIEYELLHFSL